MRCGRRTRKRRIRTKGQSTVATARMRGGKPPKQRSTARGPESSTQSRPIKAEAPFKGVVPRLGQVRLRTGYERASSHSNNTSQGVPPAIQPTRSPRWVMSEAIIGLLRAARLQAPASNSPSRKTRRTEAAFVNGQEAGDCAYVHQPSEMKEEKPLDRHKRSRRSCAFLSVGTVSRMDRSTMVSRERGDSGSGSPRTLEAQRTFLRDTASPSLHAVSFAMRHPAPARSERHRR